VRSRVLFRSDRGHYRRREAPDPQRLQRGRGFVHVKARQAFPEIGRQVRRREQTAVRASRWRRRSCRALPDAPAPPKLRDRVRGWDLEMLWGRRRDFLPGSQEVKWRDGNPPTNAWLPGFITAYNTRFGRDPANAKDLHRPLTPADDLDEILAWREERTVTRNLTLHYDRMMLLLDPNISGPSLGAPEGGSGELPGRPVRGSVQRSNARFQGVRQDPNRAARRDRRQQAAVGRVGAGKGAPGHLSGAAAARTRCTAAAAE